MTRANSYTFVQVLENPDHTGAVEQVRYDQFVRRLLKADTEQLMKLHCALGVCGEAGELADAIKREQVYKKPADVENIREELGDLFFYLHATMQMYDLTEQDVLQGNTDKLCRRYVSLAYSDQAAQDRADKLV